MTVVGAESHETLSGIATGDMSLLDEALGLREAQLERTDLDTRTSAPVRIAALIALDAPPASYAWQVANALGEGASAEGILAVPRTAAPQFRGPRVIAAAPEIMVALGLPLPEGGE